jgi:hypothetical protein
MIETNSNRVELIGTAGEILESGLNPNGTCFVRWLIECIETYTNPSDEKIIEKQKHILIAHGDTAEFIKEHLVVSAPLAIEGKLFSTCTEVKGKLKMHSEIWVCDLLMLTDDSQKNSA